MKPNKPSSTAQLVARGVVFLASDPSLGRLVPPEAAEISVQLLEEASPRASWLLWLIEKPWFRLLVKVLEAFTVPGILLHFSVRKRYLEDVTRHCLEDGTTQVVVLGAGFDTLALRLARQFPTATFIEFDHPATQAVKVEALLNQQNGRPIFICCRLI